MHEKIFILTDGCMWEINKETGNEHPHAVEVVDLETGAVRYIKSGSRIKLSKEKSQISVVRRHITSQRKKKVQRCPVLNKICRTEQGSKEYARRRHNQVWLRAYKCEFCPAWHITHKKNKLTMH